MRSNLQDQKIIKAYLYPPIRKTGVPYSGRYQVEFDGDLIVDDSRGPECDLARALLFRGITGTVEVMDAITGKHRSTVHIEKAARLRTVETGTYPRFRTAETYAQRPSAGEIDLPLVPLAEAAE